MVKLTFWTLVLTLMFQPSAFGQANQDKEPEPTKLTSLTGKVQDTSKKSIDKFTVGIKLYSYSDDFQDSKLVANWEQEFESGEYNFEVDKNLELNSSHWMSLEVVAAGYAKPSVVWKPPTQILQFDGDFGLTTLKKGVKLTGTLLPPPSSSETQVISGKVSVKQTNTGEHYYVDSKANDDGQFSFWVPEDSKFELAAYAANGAKVIKKIEVPKFAAGPEKNLGDIRLGDGVQVRGKVLDVDGEPAAGQVLVLWEVNTNERALAVATTDEQG